MDMNESPSRRKATTNFEILEDMKLLGISSSISGSSQKKPLHDIRSSEDPPPYAVALPLTSGKRVNQQTAFAGQKPLNPQDDSAPSYDRIASPSDEKVLYQPPRPFHSAVIPPSASTASQNTTAPAADVGTLLTETIGSDVIGASKEDEIARLMSQLNAAKDEIARQNKELVQQRITQHSIDEVLGSPSEANFPIGIGAAPFSGPGSRDANSSFQPSPEMSPALIDRFQGPWGTGSSAIFAGAPPQQQPSTPGWSTAPSPTWANIDTRAGPTFASRLPSAPQPMRPNNIRLDTFENEQPYFGAFGNPSYDQRYRRPSGPTARSGFGLGPFYNGADPYGSETSPDLSPSMSPGMMQDFRYPGQMPMPYQPRSIGTPLSATASEFNTGHFNQGEFNNTAPWNASASAEPTSNYMASMEPMNYRRLLDRNMTCDWKYIVEKIVCNNDQQASIFLQQKLKIATSEQKGELVDAIIAQAYPLMINRFGNFLVQRCLEHGTPQQIVAIANAIRGNTLSLSMDAFGCHVVQKAFDVVPEEFKAIMVHELLRRIPETVIHRYACHVWQKLFELRWSDSPPQIMKYVNEALRGMWHEVALGETGSLVVQNIFENCLEEDKRPAINEVIASIDVVAHGQFGNWCIQHICEHGAPPDKSRAIEHVLRFATEYSTDQFASKVVEKCLKVGGHDFMERYLDRVCEARPDRPRMPLIDISGDQYGNYLVQFILINANSIHREIVANHVRKHMVSLRGSKFGSRVAMLCCNPVSNTRPGPPVGMPINARFSPMPAMGGYLRPAPGPYR